MPGVIAGETITGLGVTEPEASSDLSRLALRARRDGDDYVLDGTKTFITHANIGSLFFVVARTGEPGRHGLSLFVVERDTPGLSNGRVFHKTGWRSADTGELVFERARVPAENLLGEEGDGIPADDGGPRPRADLPGRPGRRASARWRWRRRCRGCAPARRTAGCCGTSRPCGTGWPS